LERVVPAPLRALGHVTLARQTVITS